MIFKIIIILCLVVLVVTENTTVENTTLENTTTEFYNNYDDNNTILYDYTDENSTTTESTTTESNEFTTTEEISNEINYSNKKGFQISLRNSLTPNQTITVKKIQNKNSQNHCGQVYEQKQFILQSPNYPNQYPSDLDCSYLLKGSEFCPTYFSFQYLDFDTEVSQGCVKDRLEIDGLDALCGKKNEFTKQYYAPNGELSVRFVSDASGSGRGYRILVTRLPCMSIPTTTYSSVPQIAPDVVQGVKPNNCVPKSSPGPGGVYNLPHCCESEYKSKRFTLSSPNSLAPNTDCVYHVKKASPTVCRIRIEAQYFNLDASNSQRGQRCAGGFLEIDTKLICGCQKDLKLVSAFVGTQDVKVIRFKTSGATPGGFVLEVHQDECPKRYAPSKKLQAFESDEKHQVSLPENPNALLQKLKLVSESTEIVDENNINLPYAESNAKARSPVVKHIYIFQSPDYVIEEPAFNNKRDVEEVAYIETSNINNILDNRIDALECQNWNQGQYELLKNQNNLDQCLKTQIQQSSDGPQQIYHRPGSTCTDFNLLRGYFNSPGYPFYYPSNANVCYRFVKQPGYCGLRLIFNDFSIENSFGCHNDYLAVDPGRRYCGNSLQNSWSTVNMENRRYFEMRFITDRFSCGRGFYGVFEHIPCFARINPVPNLPSTWVPEIPSTTSVPFVPEIDTGDKSLCGSIIQDDVFNIEIHGQNPGNCVFTVRKSNENVCNLRLYFEVSQLICPSEYVIIDGNMYCSYLKGRSVTTRFLNNEIKISYNKSNMDLNGLRLKIRGSQENCQDLDEIPPAQFRSGIKKSEKYDQKDWSILSPPS